MNFLSVAFGGACGALSRYLMGLIPVRESTTFPIITFIINIIGALLIGVVVALAEKYDLNPNLVLFLKVGFCGGFTTFSTFSLETFNLFNDGKILVALSYIVLSVVCCILAVLTAKLLIK